MLQKPEVPGVGLLTASLSFQEEKMHERVSISVQRTASANRKAGLEMSSTVRITLSEGI